MADEHTSRTRPEHELTDAPVQPILLAGGALALVTALVFALSLGVFRFFSGHPIETPYNPMAREVPAAPPAPRIEVAPAIEYQQLRAHEGQILTTYGWMDRKAGITRIPIDRAIDLLLQRGYPVRKENAKK
jgi:hypothetical protein